MNVQQMGPLFTLVDGGLCQDGSKREATRIIDDLISFSVKPANKKYHQSNVPNVRSRVSYKVDVHDSYARCQLLA